MNSIENIAVKYSNSKILNLWDLGREIILLLKLQNVSDNNLSCLVLGINDVNILEW